MNTVHLWKDATKKETACGKPQGKTAGNAGDRVVLCSECSKEILPRGTSS